nr:MBL fold metallo-hydrolase [Desulfobacterales bacterium]
MRITILGSGTCVPSLKRSACSMLLRVKDNLLLFDSGPGTIRRLLEAGVHIHDINYIFYSHFHPDHTGELASFLFATKYPPVYQRRGPFTIVAARGFTRFYRGLKTAYGEWIELAPGLLRIIELDNQGADHITCGEFDVDTLPVEHIDSSIAYRITSPDGASIVYSGDTDFCPNLITISKGVDVLVCECALPDSSKVSGHLTPSLVGKIASEAGVKKLVMTHFYPECDNVDIRGECQKFYSGPIVLAEDLQEIEVCVERGIHRPEI